MKGGRVRDNSGVLMENLTRLRYTCLCFCAVYRVATGVRITDIPMRCCQQRKLFLVQDVPFFVVARPCEKKSIVWWFREKRRGSTISYANWFLVLQRVCSCNGARCNLCLWPPLESFDDGLTRVPCCRVVRFHHCSTDATGKRGSLWRTLEPGATYGVAVHLPPGRMSCCQSMRQIMMVAFVELGSVFAESRYRVLIGIGVMNTGNLRSGVNGQEQ